VTLGIRITLRWSSWQTVEGSGELHQTDLQIENGERDETSLEVQRTNNLDPYTESSDCYGGARGLQVLCAPWAHLRPGPCYEISDASCDEIQVHGTRALSVCITHQYTSAVSSTNRSIMIDLAWTSICHNYRPLHRVLIVMFMMHVGSNDCSPSRDNL
jgi:hypothetical protein